MLWTNYCVVMFGIATTIIVLRQSECCGIARTLFSGLAFIIDNMNYVERANLLMSRNYCRIFAITHYYVRR